MRPADEDHGERRDEGGPVVKGEGGADILGTTRRRRTGRVLSGTVGVLVGDRGGRREARHIYGVYCDCVFFLSLPNNNNTNETENTCQNSEVSSAGGQTVHRVT